MLALLTLATSTIVPFVYFAADNAKFARHLRTHSEANEDERIGQVNVLSVVQGGAKDVRDMKKAA